MFGKCSVNYSNFHTTLDYAPYTQGDFFDILIRTELRVLKKRITNTVCDRTV